MADIPVFGVIDEVPAGGSGSLASVGGMLDVNTTTVGNDADTDEKTLMSYSLPANTLSKDGQGLRISIMVSTAGNGNDKVIKLKFGSATLNDTGTVTWNAERVLYQVEVYRTGVGSQDVWFSRLYNTGQFQGVTATAQDETGAIVIAITGQSPTTGAANDVTANIMSTEFLNF